MPGTAESDDLSKYWQDQINSWKTSSKSQASFCKTHDLSYHRFTYWRRKFDERHSESGGFALVKYRSEGTSSLSVVLPNGLVVQGIASDNLELTRQLLASLA
jgi:hypothetical protein